MASIELHLYGVLMCLAWPYGGHGVPLQLLQLVHDNQQSIASESGGGVD